MLILAQRVTRKYSYDTKINLKPPSFWQAPVYSASLHNGVNKIEAV